MSEARLVVLECRNNHRLDPSQHLDTCYRPAFPADLLAAVRRGVESGTIEGLQVRDDGSIHCDRCLHVSAVEDPDFDWPVSDGGEDR